MLIENEPVDKDSKLHLSFGIGKWNSSKKKCKKDKKIEELNYFMKP